MERLIKQSLSLLSPTLEHLAPKVFLLVGRMVWYKPAVALA